MIKRLVISLVLFNALQFPALGQRFHEEKVKAVFLYNFIHFVQWPGTPGHPFTIATIGGNPFGRFIEEAVAGELVNGSPVQVKHVRSMGELESCNILYIHRSMESRVGQIIDQLKGKPVLTVSDIPAFYRYGGMIRFYEENFKIRLEINPAAARASSLVISSKLLRSARIREHL